MTKHLKNPLVWFFIFAFGLPWIGWSSLKIFEVNEPGPLRTALFYTGDFCSVAGLVAMFVQSGKAGVIDLLKRCIRVNVSPLWWLITLVLPISIVFGGYAVVGAMGDGIGRVDFSGLARYLTVPALLAVTTGPLGEELGWRGYLTPKLLESRNAIVVSLIVGFLWGIWHLPLYISGAFSTFMGGFTFTLGTMLTSIIMTAILLHTRGSVLIAVLYHWLINVSSGVVAAMLPDFNGDIKQVSLIADLGVKSVIVVVLIMVLGKNLTRNKTMEWWGQKV